MCVVSKDSLFSCFHNFVNLFVILFVLIFDNDTLRWYLLTFRWQTRLAGFKGIRGLSLIA